MRPETGSKFLVIIFVVVAPSPCLGARVRLAKTAGSEPPERRPAELPSSRTETCIKI